MAPETGAMIHSAKANLVRLIVPVRASPVFSRTQRPKWGRSPLRMAMRLLAVRRRSMEAIRRPNRVLEGRRPMDAVLDMCVPFSWRGTIPLRDLGTIYVYQIPATTGLFA